MKKITRKIFITLFYSSLHLFCSACKAAALPEKSNSSYNNTNSSDADWKDQLRDFELTLNAEIDYVDNLIDLIKDPYYSFKDDSQRPGLDLKMLYDTRKAYSSEDKIMSFCVKDVKSNHPKVIKQSLIHQLDREKILYSYCVKAIHTLRQKDFVDESLQKFESELRKLHQILHISLLKCMGDLLQNHPHSNILYKIVRGNNQMSNIFNITSSAGIQMDVIPVVKNEDGSLSMVNISQDDQTLAWLYTFNLKRLPKSIDGMTLNVKDVSDDPLKQYTLTSYPKTAQDHNINVVLSEIVSLIRSKLGLSPDWNFEKKLPLSKVVPFINNWHTPLKEALQQVDLYLYFREKREKLNKAKKLVIEKFGQKPLQILTDAELNKLVDNLIKKILQVKEPQKASFKSKKHRKTKNRHGNRKNKHINKKSNSSVALVKNQAPSKQKSPIPILPSITAPSTSKESLAKVEEKHDSIDEKLTTNQKKKHKAQILTNQQAQNQKKSQATKPLIEDPEDEKQMDIQDYQDSTEIAQPSQASILGKDCNEISQAIASATHELVTGTTGPLNTKLEEAPEMPHNELNTDVFQNNYVEKDTMAHQPAISILPSITSQEDKLLGIIQPIFPRLDIKSIAQILEKNTKLIKRFIQNPNAEVFYNTVTGLDKSQEVRIKHFKAFLVCVYGEKVKHTNDGYITVQLKDKSVEIHYRIPNLDPATNEDMPCCQFKTHQPHGNKSFPQTTLKNFLKRNLEKANYIDSNTGKFYAWEILVPLCTIAWRVSKR